MAYKYTIKGIRKFNEYKVVEQTKRFVKDLADKLHFTERQVTPTDEEVESFTMTAEDVSTQGVNIKFYVGETIIVELPWIASEWDVRLCYAFLHAVVKVHRTARILDEEEKSAKLTDCDAEEQWNQRFRNMEDILNKGEGMVLAGVNRDFYLQPSRYHVNGRKKDGVSAAFRDFMPYNKEY